MAFIEEHGAALYLKQAIPDLFGETFKKRYPQKLQEWIDRLQTFRPESLVAYLHAMMQRPDRSLALQALNMPTGFIIGGKDALLSPEDGLSLASSAANPYTCLLEDAGHMGPLEAPEIAGPFLNRFLENALS